MVDVESSRFDDVMTACVAENIFTNDRVTEFGRGVMQISPMEWMNGLTKVSKGLISTDTDSLCRWR